MQRIPYKNIHLLYDQLLPDTRKRGNQIQPLINEAISILQLLEKDQTKSASSSVIEKLIEPLNSMVKQKFTKSYHLILSIFQSLSAAELLAFKEKTSFLDMANKMIESGDEMVMIKIVQVMLIMINNSHVAKTPFADKVLSLCLKLFGNKSHIVKNNIFAVLRQMYSLLFDQYAAKLKLQTAESPERIENTELHKICYEQLDQLIAISDGKYKQVNYRGLGMDMLSVIMAGFSLIDSPQIVGLIEKTYVPYLNNYLVSEVNSFPIITRAVKSTTQIILTLENSYNLLQSTIFLAGLQSSWQRYLALESFCVILSKAKQLQNMHILVNDVTNTKLLRDVIFSIMAIILKSQKTTTDCNMKLSLMRVHEISEAISCNPPNPTFSQYLCLFSDSLLLTIGETLANLIGSLEELFTIEGIKLGKPASQPFTVKQTEEVIDILNYSWKPIHEMLEYIIKESNNELQIQQALYNIQSLIRITGTVGFELALQTMLEDLCAWQFPKDLDERTFDNSNKHIYVCKTIFTTAQSLHGILRKPAWECIFKALERINTALYKNKEEIVRQQFELIQLGNIKKKISEGFNRYLKDSQSDQENFPQRRLEPSAGTGEVQSSSQTEGNKNNDSMSGSPSLPDEDDKEEFKLHKLRKSSIKTEGNTIELASLSYDIGINLYKPNNRNDTAIPQLSKLCDIRGEIKNFKSSLDSLFIFTSLFEDETLVEFIAGIGQVIKNSLENVDVNNNKANTYLFGLTKLLETSVANIYRIHSIWECLASYFDFFSKFEETQTKLLAINAITCIIINIFDYRKDRIWEGINIPKWDTTEWQADVLIPLKDCITPECTYEVAFNIYQIIKDCGPFIAREGWDLILSTLKKIIISLSDLTLSQQDSNSCIEEVFKSIEDICNNSLYKIHISNLDNFIPLICCFANFRDGNVFVQPSVIFIQNVADCLSQQQLSGKLANVPPEKVNELWISLFDKLKLVGDDEREDLRNTSYKTLGKIIENNGKDLSLTIWSYVLLKLTDDLMRFVTNNYFNYSRSIMMAVNNIKSTPKFVETEITKLRIMRFDNEAIAKNTERQKIREQSWENSIQILYTNLLKILIKKVKDELLNKFLSMLMENWLMFSKSCSHMILTSIYDSIHEILVKCAQYVINQIDNIWEIFKNSINCVIEDQSLDIASSKPLILKLIPSLIEVFKVMTSSTANLMTTSDDLLKVYELLKKILSNTGFLGGLNIANSTRLIQEERLIFDFIEHLPNTFISKDSYNAYFDFLLEFLNFSDNHPHSDGFIRRTLLIIKNFLTLHKLDKAFIMKLLEKLYSKLTEIINLRFEEKACKALLFSSKDTEPLWYVVGKFFVRISTFFINSELYGEEMQLAASNNDELMDIKVEEVKQVEKLELYKKLEKVQDNSKELTVDPEIQQLVWTHMIKLIKTVLKAPEDNFKDFDKSLIEEVTKKSQDLNIILINFILKVLLPSSTSLPKDLQKELIDIIDNGFISFNTPLINSPVNRSVEALSKFCISTLFELCDSEEKAEENFIAVKQKVAYMTTKVLVNRCKAIFHKYISDEKKNTTSLPKNRKTDLIELIKKLRQTSIFPNSMAKCENGIAELLAKEKAHLIYLMPEVVECLATKELDLRDSLKELLKDINRITMKQLPKLY